MKYIRLLALIPFIGMLGFLPLVNRVTPFVLGLPFILFWMLLWVVLTTVTMLVIYRFDPECRKERME